MSQKDALLDALVAAAVRLPVAVVLESGAEVEIRGLTILEVCRIVQRFPAMKRQILSTLGLTDGESDGFASVLVDAGPDLIGAVFAVAAGRPNDKRIEAAMAGLGDVDTMNLIAAVKSATMPEGLGAFFARLLPTAIQMGILTEKQATDLIEKMSKAFEEETADIPPSETSPALAA